MKKLLRDHRAFLRYLDLKFPQFQPRKGNFLLYPYNKVIGLTNFELRISNYQSKVQEFSHGVLILPKLSDPAMLQALYKRRK